MYAILIHYSGFALLGALLPPMAVEVESGFACIWYAAFALIDVMAMCCTTSRWLKFVLAISCAWSATLAIETAMLQDLLQSHDYIAQRIIDGMLVACALGLLTLRLHGNRKVVV